VTRRIKTWRSTSELIEALRALDGDKETP